MKTAKQDSQLKGFDAYTVSLGDLLRGERATLGKSLEDIQSDLKISSKYILAIENGDLSVFDTYGFIAGYVRTYARYLNMDAEKSYRQFCEETGFDGAVAETSKNISVFSGRLHSSIPLSPVANDADIVLKEPISINKQFWYEKISFSALVSFSVLTVLVGGLCYGGWWFLQEIQRVQFAPVNETPGVVSDIAVLSDGALSESALNENADPVLERNETVATAINPKLSLDQLYRPEELDIPNVVSRDGPIATIDTNLQGTLAPQLIPSSLSTDNIENDAPVTVLQDAPVFVDVVATRPAWIRIYQSDGSVLFEKILNANERYRVPNGLEDVFLKAGNSGNVYLLIGDISYGPLGTQGSVAREVSLNRAYIAEAYQQVSDIFSAPLAPPVNVDEQQYTAEAILQDVEGN